MNNSTSSRNKELKWVTLKEKQPEYNTPIIIFKKKGFLSVLFDDKNEEIKICLLTKKTETNEGLIFSLKSYDLNKYRSTPVFEKDFHKLYWMYLPSPPKYNS